MPAAKKTTNTADEPSVAVADDEPRRKTADEKTPTPVGSGVAVPQVTEEGQPPVGPAPGDELELSDDVDDNMDLGTKTAEEVWPEAANPAGVPDFLPLFPNEKVTETKTAGDVTWWHTDADRWLTTKGNVAGSGTMVTQGPEELPPPPEELRERNKKHAELQAEWVEEGEKVIAERNVELSVEANEAGKEENEKRAKAQAEQQKIVDQELADQVVALEAKDHPDEGQEPVKPAKEAEKE